MDTNPTPPVKRSFFATLFLSPTEPRLRAGWRLLIQTVGLLVIAMCVGVPLSILGLIAGLGDTGNLLLSSVIELFAFTITVLLSRRFLDRRSIVSLGLRITWRTFFDIIAGIIITFFQMGLIYVILYLLGWIRFEGFAWQSEAPTRVIINTLLMMFQFVLVGWNEELLSRGYHLQTIASGFDRSGQGLSGWPLAFGVLLSSAIFGILHLTNPNANWISTLGIFMAGLFLALPFILTKQLWLSIGLHIGWNFFEGVVFGFPVSGLNIYSLTRITVTGSQVWTGGAFGPEAGLIVLPSLVFGALLVYIYVAICKRIKTIPSPIPK